MTRKALITAVALLLAVIVNAQYKAGYSDLGDSETVSAFKEHVATISSVCWLGGPHRKRSR